MITAKETSEILSGATTENNHKATQPADSRKNSDLKYQASVTNSSLPLSKQNT
jgi:hypothetical protein